MAAMPYHAIGWIPGATPTLNHPSRCEPGCTGGGITIGWLFAYGFSTIMLWRRAEEENRTARP
jgi:hypothetical protein